MRRAIREPEDEGPCGKRHGRSTFVSIHRVETGLAGFSDGYSLMDDRIPQVLLAVEETAALRARTVSTSVRRAPA